MILVDALAIYVAVICPAALFLLYCFQKSAYRAVDFKEKLLAFGFFCVFIIVVAAAITAFLWGVSHIWRWF